METERRHNEVERDESRWVDMAIKRDAGAFGRLYDMHVERIYRHIYYRVGNVADTEDLTQQVFLKAWQAIDRYKKRNTPFVAWLMTISHNQVVDFYRTRKNIIYIEEDLPVSGTEASPEEMLETSFHQQEIRRAILRLSEDQQKVVILRFIEGFDNREIASATGKSEGAIRVILHRGLAGLKRLLEEKV